MVERWSPGDVVVRREVLGLAPVAWPAPQPEWLAQPWFAVPVRVVEDTDDALVTYIAPGAEFGFFDRTWPTPDGRHPWAGRRSWEGHGVLMVQPPGEHHAIWHFWEGPERAFRCWYLNLQTAFERTEIGYDTQDLELDIVVPADGSWVFKDRELLADRVAEGRFTGELVEWILEVGDDLVARLQRGSHWWDDSWAEWTPHADWEHTALPSGWDTPTPRAEPTGEAISSKR